ncbi:bifunctional diaminohydroxyphosphoribosylaminopyrimidine deaminase/5-amino-6-(5-phosphoribosylamino)uracil reductase RibD [Aquibacillus rhizosphaerae]|uniref:Riboflavin biosynthesis protein RibD n=1 Tax=Aquibacillus rhizosphaerae TaxID=3051431 RepID=A0ABT7L5D8_9BACI|nr:bifunctional diaminohydroxyphosphoribosylaminopyrimidine deaminase/5-amino-6-(5-phosphoribosylamino)uracil reductase RibD [Aquibacillus sp. LR5S19]MDL4841083.1 bifunctional diaminohydroxyphosphoribosylaminopyrimidine deaminase/5-amino-6-(5-phosphoribosylamino)uracil reductase RibD [Aquibacillus sp. LR5S19]
MTHDDYMKVALSVAEATVGQTSPNPSVGAVVVKNRKILGIGSHLEPGKEHAEVHALKQAGSSAEGADIYVTLEPCSHYGKTPPCADLIIEHKLRKVYVACLDPNPAVAGKGVEKLRQAGIEVEVGLQETRATELNSKFFHFIQSKRPYVTLKVAMTLDGKTATSTGDSRWITSEKARIDVHKQRHIHDAILVGVNTVLKDNPHLTTRLPQGGKNPIRVILDTHLKIQEHAFVLNDDAPTKIICGSNPDIESFKLKHPNVQVIQLTTDDITTEDVLDILGEQGIQSLYVEGGSTVHATFIERRLFNECHWYIAPKLLGGADAISAVGGKSPTFMKEAALLEFTSVEQLGQDIKLIVRPNKEGE